MLVPISEWFAASPGWTVLSVLLLPPLVASLVFRGVRSRDARALEERSAESEAALPLEAPPNLRDLSVSPDDTERVADSPEPSPPPAEVAPLGEADSTPSLDAIDTAFPDPAEAPGAEPDAIGMPPSAPAPSLASRLARTSEALVGRIGSLLGGRKVDAEVLEDLEAMLFGADLGVGTADALLEAVRARAGGGDADAVRAVLREEIETRLSRVAPSVRGLTVTGSPHVILVLGVNGSGKTTTIGKLAARYTRDGKRVVLGAGDTFRAAASRAARGVGRARRTATSSRGNRAAIPRRLPSTPSRPPSARDADVAIIDTAGRLADQRAPDRGASKNRSRDRTGLRRRARTRPSLVLDANTGQNAISQARVFTEAAGVTGIVLTKLDGTAKGVVSWWVSPTNLRSQFALSGSGEGIDDLRDFDAGGIRRGALRLVSDPAFRPRPRSGNHVVAGPALWAARASSGRPRINTSFRQRSTRSPVGSSTTPKRSGKASLRAARGALDKRKGIGSGRRGGDWHHQPTRNRADLGAQYRVGRFTPRLSGNLAKPRRSARGCGSVVWKRWCARRRVS